MMGRAAGAAPGDINTLRGWAIMNSATPDVKSVFGRALELPTLAARAAFLDEACNGNAALRVEVDGLLEAHEQAGGFLRAPAPAPAITTPGAAPAEGPGTRIGPYKLLQQLGEGGMGVVYMAEQEEPIRRRVAMKIIKPGMDSAQVFARFEVERQALALMDHQNIARVLDAGTIPSPLPLSPSGERGRGEGGRPYFVMELVHGVPITQYCDANKLSPRQRLELFVPVCLAMQHAHQKGVIHRDLKPSNVMVTLHDGQPVPKVIDFGVAKATDQRFTERTLFTQYGTIVGTLEYMAPEQAEMSGLGVDTRSDIYALGVLLYELLTGTTPLERSRLRDAAYDEMLRLIREEEPARPSRRISTAGDRLATISAARGTEPAQLSRLVCGELDWIVMRCLEKDRTRRYDAASSLARDIQRYLADEPVEACPPSAGYRLRKFARKYKKLLVTAAAFAALLLVGGATSAWQAVRATDAEGVANANAAKAEKNAQDATKQRDEAQRQHDEVKALYSTLQETQAELRRTLYAAHINLAQHALNAAGIDRVEELLQYQIPKQGENDLRRFEWHYLTRLCHSDLLTLQHTSAVQCVAYDREGKRLATVSGGIPDGDGEMKVWDAQTGKELHSFKGGFRCIAFSPDGTRLAALAGSGQVKVWDAETGKEVFALGQAKPRGYLCFAFSPDGKLLATGGFDVLDVWDAKTGKERLPFPVKEMIRSLVFSTDSKRLASVAGDRPGGEWAVKVWEAETAKELKSISLLAQASVVAAVAYNPDGKHLAIASYDGTVKVWEVEAGKAQLTLQGHSGGTSSVAYNADGTRLASAGYDRTVKVWDAATGRELFTIKGHSSVVTSVSFSPDGKRLASAAGDKTVRVWNTQVGQHPMALDGGGLVNSVAVSPNGKLLAATGRAPLQPGKGPLNESQVKVWDIESGKELHSFKAGGVSVAFSSDGKRLAAAGLTQVRKPAMGLVVEGEVKVYDTETGNELFALNGGGTSVTFSPDGKLLASAGRGEGLESEVKVWDAQTGKEYLTRKGGGIFQGFTPDGGPSVAFSPDSTQLASASGKEIKVWEVRTGKERLAFKAGGITVAFSRDGKHLASAGEGEVKVWDAQTGKDLLTLKGHTDAWVGRIVYSPDGKRLVTTSRDKTVKIWDAQSGLELLTLEGHGGLFNGLAFSPDGHRLFSGAADGTVKIWDATPLAEKR
jgi:WD40 repeat protein/serine/threonine protein kinase